MMTAVPGPADFIGSAVALMPTANFMTVMLSAEEVVSVLKEVTCQAYGFAATEVASVEQSVIADGGKPTLDLGDGGSYLVLKRGIKVQIPSSALNPLARSLAAEFPDFAPICFELQWMSSADYEMSEEENTYPGKILLARRPELLGYFDSPADHYLHEIITGCPVDAGHFWDGHVGTFDFLNGRALGHILLDAVLAANNLRRLLDRIEMASSLVGAESYSSLACFGWRLLDRRPFELDKFADQLLRIFKRNLSPGTLIEAVQSMMPTNSD